MGVEGGATAWILREAVPRQGGSQRERELLGDHETFQMGERGGGGVKALNRTETADVGRMMKGERPREADKEFGLDVAVHWETVEECEE